MREWTSDDLARWGQQIRDEELSYQNQLEIVAYSKDMHELYNAATAEIFRLRSLWLLVSNPVSSLMRLSKLHGEGLIGDGDLGAAVKYYMGEIEQGLGS